MRAIWGLLAGASGFGETVVYGRGRSNAPFEQTSAGRRGALALVAGIASIGLVLAGIVFSATPAVADTAPPAGQPETVTSVPLPTAQIDGVAWTQAIAGDTVYVGGEFTTARPAGAAAGVNTSPRANLMAYTLSTGVMTSWNPGANGAIKAIATSPDGTRIYVAGTFTQIAGATRNRIAAFDAVTGALLPWNPGANSTVADVVAYGNTVWLVGSFSSVAGGARTRIAAVNATSGALLPFSATVAGGYGIRSIVVSPGGDKLVIAGSFTSTNGSTDPGRGMAALDAVTGASMPWAVNSLIRNAGEKAAMMALASDGDSVYGVGYDFGGGPEDGFEDVFRANWSDGSLVWMTDCHGDDYSVAVSGGVVYSASHDHYCGNIGGFPQTSPKWSFHHSLAYAKDYLGNVLTPDIYGYKSYTGQPAGTLLQWYPDWQIGTYTGKSQAGWDVTANDDYVLYGGEFLRVNNVGQQGLVRFAKKSIAPDTDGPRLSGSAFPVTPLSIRAGEVRLSWTANSDRDNATLTYQLFRQDKGSTPIYTTTADSNFWTTPELRFTDSTVTPGTTYQYRVRAIDPNGNTATGSWASVTASADTLSDYAATVLSDGAQDYWPLSEASGSTSVNWANGSDLQVNAATRGASGPDLRRARTATTFAGSNSSFAATSTSQTGPQSFTVEAWFRTTSTAGGKIVGFGNSQTGDSGNYDRHVYIDGSGTVTFGVYPGAVRTLQSSAGFNDGRWHYVAASLGSGGMTLSIDGKRVASRVDTTAGQSYSGFWKVGGDSLGGWPGVGSSTYLAGDIADVATYPTVLTREQIDAHWVASGRTSVIPPAPADAYGKAVYDLAPSLYWRLGEQSGPTAQDAGPDSTTGTFFGDVTHGVAGAITGVGNTAITVNPHGGDQTGIVSNRSFSNPTTFSLETWFKTTTTSGGKIIGFGNAATGTSSSFDRHVYMSGDGRVKFGVWPGSAQVVESGPGYNDGRWHLAVAQMSDSGMQLYLDGALIATNPNSSAQAYDGYWRVGGDSGWEGDTYWSGSIDEVAVYPTLLSADQVHAHWDLGMLGYVNQPPVAAFSSLITDLDVAFDASASSDPEGPVASYAWDFGDGQTGDGKTASHTYAAGGSYSVTLTVKDAQGVSAVKTQTVVVVAPNILPTASFDAKTTFSKVALDASASSDTDGSIVSFSWAYGDGQTGTGVTSQHTYAAPGSYTVSLTVTDDRGGSATSESVVTTATDPGAPSDAYGSAVYALGPTLYWRLGETSPAGAADSGPLDHRGTYIGNVETGVAGALAGVANTAIATHPGAGQTGVVSADAFTNPTTFAIEAWFKTDSTSGGKIVGFGSSNAGESFHFDRHVYMTNDGRVRFGAWTGSQQVVQSAPGFNDDHWHHVVAQLSGAGQQLYVDGQLVDSSSNASAEDYTGYWRVGGDNGWDGDTYWRGSVDEVAVYPAALTSDQVAAHHLLGAQGTTNTPPTASFSNSVNGMDVGFDGSASSDLDGPIAAYAWDFGDGATGSGATTTHTYANPGTYNVTLVVTDSEGDTAAISRSVVVERQNQAPVADFSVSVNALNVTVDGGSSNDTDGTIASYAWTFGDGTVASGQSITHAYAQPGSYDITLVVTDDQGAVSAPFTKTVTAVAPNQPPTAAFSAAADGLSVAFDSTGSSDPDGSVAAYAWQFGDGATSTDASPSHTYAAAGTYTVTLTVTDDLGATSSMVSHDVTVTKPNQAPSASFTSNVSGLTVAFDASASADPDGTIASYDWTFGDGATGSGATASHTFAAAGTFNATLTVTDDRGATSSKSADVTVSIASAVLAKDGFERAAVNGWGVADQGGAWSIGTGSSSRFAVTGGAGVITVNSSSAQAADLKSVSSSSALVTTTFSVDKVANGTYVQAIGRQVGSDQYIARVRIAGDGSAMLYVLRNGTPLGAGVSVGGVTITPGTAYSLAFKVTGTAPTSLSVKLWKASDTEPVAWALTRSDSTLALQSPGSVGLHIYVPASAAAYPVKISFADLSVTDPAVVVAPVNQAPVASFQPSVSGLSVAVDASASSDPDGTIAGFAWDFGDGSQGTGATASHTYAAAGTYAVKLTVTDDKGATAVSSQTVTAVAAPGNQSPVAAFVPSVSGLSASVDGSASSDPDGSVASYDWDFGDGSQASGVTASHTYATSGSYVITLTVTDDKGGSAASTQTVSVSAAASNVVARDAFERSDTNGWGSADAGGPWTVVSGAAASFSVSGGAGVMRAASSTGLQADLPGVASANAVVSASFSVDKIANGQYITVIGRQVGADSYSLRARVAGDGTVQLYVLRNATAIGAPFTVAGLVLAPNTSYTLAFGVSGTSPTTLTGKLWASSDAEPAWQVTRTDASGSLQAAGAVGVNTWVPGSAGAYPVTLSVSDFSVTDPTVH